MSGLSRSRALFCATLLAVAAGVATAIASLGSAGGHAASGTDLPWARQADPVVFLKTVVRQLAANRYATAWLTLDPVQQRYVLQAEYVRCEMTSPIPGRLARLDVVRVFDEPVTVSGHGGTSLRAKAVDLRIVIIEPSLHASVVIRHTVHALRTGGRWAWILPAARFKLHRSGSCPSSPTVSGGPSV